MITHHFQDKTILITGGTGSFGNAFLDILLTLPFGEIRIFSRDELKQEQMRVRLAHSQVKFYIGDVRDRASVADAMKGVDFVFHAAALKQVPSCEFFPVQAVQTNVLGSQNVVESAIAAGVKKIIVLSTDKAVYPINAMGMTKALMEKIALSASRKLGPGETLINAVRYGNVMASRGSVIPLFLEQIRKGHPITVTDPDMTRFLLPLREAIELVVFAFEHGRQGDLFVKKSPACTVADLATAMKAMFASPVPIHQIGTRHGEKLFETLVSREELLRAEDMGDYYRIPSDSRDLNYQKYFTEGVADDDHPRGNDDYTSHNTQRLDVAGVDALLRTLPEIRAALAETPPA